MKIHTPFSLNLPIQHKDDTWVPISFRCRSCKRLEKAIVCHNLLLVIGGSQLDCYNCSPGHWELAFEALGTEVRDNRRKLRRVRLNANSTFGRKYT